MASPVEFQISVPVSSNHPSLMLPQNALAKRMKLQHTTTWTYDREGIFPSPTYCQSMIEFLAHYDDDDSRIRFTFKQASPDIFIHQSRLRLMGGPLFVLAAGSGFREHKEKTVQLCEEDDPKTFRIFREYMYANAILLMDLSDIEILRAIKSAHRWRLMTLLIVLFDYTRKFNFFDNKATLQCAMELELMTLPDVPVSFKEYFWESVGNFYDHFVDKNFIIPEACHLQFHFVLEEAMKRAAKYEHFNDELYLPSSNDEDDGFRFEQGLEKIMCGPFRSLWRVATCEGYLRCVVRRALRYTVYPLKMMKAYLLCMVLRVMEPQLENDDAISNAIEMLLDSSLSCEEILSSEIISRFFSARAIRLLAKGIMSKREHVLEASLQLPGDFKTSFCLVKKVGLSPLLGYGIVQHGFSGVGFELFVKTNGFYDGALNRLQIKVSVFAKSIGGTSGEIECLLRFLDNGIDGCSEPYVVAQGKVVHERILRMMLSADAKSTISRSYIISYDTMHTLKSRCIEFKYRCKPVLNVRAKILKDYTE